LIALAYMADHPEQFKRLSHPEENNPTSSR
jgi:hypothetical protein